MGLKYKNKPDEDSAGISKTIPDGTIQDSGLGNDIQNYSLTTSINPTIKTPQGLCDHGDLEEGRNLVISVDGTGNQFGKKNTNVIELYKHLEKEEESDQLTWYSSGIGTYAKPESWLTGLLQSIDHNIDKATAWNFKRTLLAAYQWLSEHYKKGDRIFLFGFSRGAFQVRVLSAMIDKVGLIHKGNATQIPFAYQIYCDPDSEKVPQSTAADKKQCFLRKRFEALCRIKGKEIPNSDSQASMAQNFKQTFSRDVKVHFIGVWDTVSSIGIVREIKMLPHTVDGMKHVCYFRHALALDERRVKFLPEYVYGGSAAEQESGQTPSRSSSVSSSSSSSPPHTLEVWFAGTHSDIGGGNRNNQNLNRSRPPLRWMVYEARALGLRTQLFDRRLTPGEKLEVKESLKGFWWHLFEMVPWKRLTYTREENGKGITYKPHRGHARKIHPTQKIHTSVISSLGQQTRSSTYWPKARLPAESSWGALCSSETARFWERGDADEHIRTCMSKLVKEDDEKSWRYIEQIAKSGDDQQAIYEEFIRYYNSANQNDVCKDMELRRRVWKKILGLPWDKSVKRQGLDTDSVEIDSYRLELEITGCTSVVLSIAFSPIDQTRSTIVSNFGDNTIMIWDANTGEQIGQARDGHAGEVNCVAFSHNGAQIVSGSDDCTVRIWDTDATSSSTAKQLEGHPKGLVNSVAFTRDGTMIASGSVDTTIQIWDARTGNRQGKALVGHEHFVMSVAFSPDQEFLVSGSVDHTLRIWDVKTQEQVGQELTGHQESVLSVAFSNDGKNIVSGSRDKTIRLWQWDKTTRIATQVGEPLEGHEGEVKAVAFSPNGKHIVSGSFDRTVRIWDVATRKQIGRSLEGHTYGVNSVSFSPDGTLVASGSGDKTIRLWDISLRLLGVAHIS